MRAARGRLARGIRVGLGPAVILGLVLGGTGQASALTPRNGHYAGRGRPITAGVATWADFSFDVKGGVVEDGWWSGNGIGGCGYGDEFMNSVAPDNQGRFELDFNDGVTAGTLKGRFVSPTEVKGRFLFTDTTYCPQVTTTFKVALARFGAKAPSGGSSKVRSGHYAAAGKDFDLWFDVKNRKIGVPVNDTYAKVSEDGCSTSAVGFTTPTIGPRGHFKATASDPNFEYALLGRFFSPTALAGSLNWQINSFCSPGSFDFYYTGKLFRISR